MLALYKQLIVQFYHLDDVQYVKTVKNRRINKKEAHGYMNSLEYENLLENKTHADPMFPYNTTCAPYHLTSILCLCTGMNLWRLSISKKAREM